MNIIHFPAPAEAEARGMIREAAGFLDKFYGADGGRCSPRSLAFLSQTAETLLIRELQLDSNVSERAQIAYWLAALAAHLRRLSAKLETAEDAADKPGGAA